MKPSINTHSFTSCSDNLFQKPLEQISISHSILSHIPFDIAIEYKVFPFAIDKEGRINVLMNAPFCSDTIQKVQILTNSCIVPYEYSNIDITSLIFKYYGISKKKQINDTLLKATHNNQFNLDKNASIISIVNDIIHEAIRLYASDIHFEPFEQDMRVRFRIDGVLQETLIIEVNKILPITSRIKIMAHLDIAEKRRSQDGRISITDNNKDVDIRVSTLPTDFGEKIVLRILDKKSFDFNLDTIGMDQEKLSVFKHTISMPNGIILITGPTGSGKTTTLYGAINFLKKPGINISTIEDPIEYNISGISQTQVKPHIGLTFAALLRSLLRQDPNIIMVGEMRDHETAEIAIRSSLTGHLVLSTLHTNDAAAAITRLIDMGIEPYLVASSITLIIAQRLVRKICQQCKIEDRDMESKKKQNELRLHQDITLYKGNGCSSCGFTGYKGRTGIFEVLPMTEDIRKLINTKAYVSDIRSLAISQGLTTLKQSALSKLKDGTTSIEEVFREISVIS